jgi:hypothetical protein
VANRNLTLEKLDMDRIAEQFEEAWQELDDEASEEAEVLAG